MVVQRNQGHGSSEKKDFRNILWAALYSCVVLFTEHFLKHLQMCVLRFACAKCSTSKLPPQCVSQLKCSLIVHRALMKIHAKITMCTSPGSASESRAIMSTITFEAVKESKQTSQQYFIVSILFCLYFYNLTASGCSRN